MTAWTNRGTFRLELDGVAGAGWAVGAGVAGAATRDAAGVAGAATRGLAGVAGAATRGVAGVAGAATRGALASTMWIVIVLGIVVIWGASSPAFR